MSRGGAQPSFASRLLAWFALHGRHDLPWQHPRHPYRVWISEVMLQQTQVGTVIPYFERFMLRFPDVQRLAAAPIDEVLKHWAGLGYYARARNLHRAARELVVTHGGEFPRTLEALTALPGIGRSTAGAILAQAFGLRHSILDGNVRRVLARHAGIAGWPGEPRVQSRLWSIADDLLPEAGLADYTQALMDLGSGVCRARAPLCPACPVAQDCVARAQDRIAELPGPKPARARPQRAAHLLLITNDAQDILVERRAPAGIWGGLWCLPLGTDGEAWPQLAQRLALHVDSAQALPAIRHAFTHFDLELLPIRTRAVGALDQVCDTTACAWIKLSAPETWPGLPAPIAKLLERLRLQEELALPAPDPRLILCPAPSTASSSTRKPRDSTARPTRASSASGSSKASPRKPGSSGSSTRRG